MSFRFTVMVQQILRQGESEAVSVADAYLQDTGERNGTAVAALMWARLRGGLP